MIDVSQDCVIRRECWEVSGVPWLEVDLNFPLEVDAILPLVFQEAQVELLLL